MLLMVLSHEDFLLKLSSFSSFFFLPLVMYVVIGIKISVYSERVMVSTFTEDFILILKKLD